MQGLVTVFGGSGFIGHYAVRALARAGWRVRVAVRRPTKAPELKVMGDVGQIELVQANLKVPETIGRALDGAAACVNLAGVLWQSGSQKFEALHVTGAQDIAEACAARGIERLVHISSISADPKSGSAYARTKAEGEAAVRAALATATLVRPTVAFGPEDTFFNRFAGMAGASPILPLIGGGETRIQPVYAGDIGAAIVAILASPASVGRTYELGGPGVYSFRQLMELMLKETHQRRVLLPLPFAIAKLLGYGGDLIALTPFAPPVTSDQVELARDDAVVHDGASGLAELGVTPTALEAILPTYLWRYRNGGQFAQPGAANA